LNLDSSLDMEMMFAHAEKAETLLKLLSHKHRLLILCLLLEGEKTVFELEQVLKLRQPAISQHLSRLRFEDVVETRRDGKNVFYSFKSNEIRTIIASLNQAFCKLQTS
jgi:DNA-binding transcriptional ArsR family regulator